MDLIKLKHVWLIINLKLQLFWNKGSPLRGWLCMVGYLMHVLNAFFSTIGMTAALPKQEYHLLVLQEYCCSTCPILYTYQFSEVQRGLLYCLSSTTCAWFRWVMNIIKQCSWGALCSSLRPMHHMKVINYISINNHLLLFCTPTVVSILFHFRTKHKQTNQTEWSFIWSASHR